MIQSIACDLDSMLTSDVLFNLKTLIPGRAYSILTSELFFLFHRASFCFLTGKDHELVKIS